MLRIERALHEFGVLNLYPRVMRDEEVEAARVDVERALGAERASTCPARWERASASAQQAYRRLRRGAARARVGKRRGGDAPRRAKLDERTANDESCPADCA